MERKEINLSRFQAKDVTLNNTINCSDIFIRENRSYMCEFGFFAAYFNCIPNFTHERKIDCRKANIWFMELYKDEIKDCFYTKIHLDINKKPELDDIFYILYEDLVVYFDTNNSVVRFLFRKTNISKIDEVITGIRKFKEKKKKDVPEIELLINTRTGISTKSLEITKPKLSIEDNYNDDFKEIHQTILKRLSKKNDKGLVLLHGKPGTGKTSYIRYLITMVKKNVIFLPPNMASAITNPDLMSTLIDNTDSIFIIEDAENIVVDREKDGHSPVSALLNISDGLLSDCLNIQIICSFNIDISKVDSALLRKGRMIAKYEFKELEVNKAQALSNKLSFKTIISKPMTLTEIYNQEEMSFVEKNERVAIGFRRSLPNPSDGGALAQVG